MIPLRLLYLILMACPTAIANDTPIASQLWYNNSIEVLCYYGGVYYADALSK